MTEDYASKASVDRAHKRIDVISGSVNELIRSNDRLVQQMTELVAQLDNLFSGTFQPKSCVEHTVKIQQIECEIDQTMTEIKEMRDNIRWVPDAVRTMRRYVYGGVSSVVLASVTFIVVTLRGGA